LPKLQEDLDNAQVMKMFNKVGCRYPIFLEDDAIADENWYDMLQTAINQLDTMKDWFAVKLFVARYQRNYKALRAGINSYDQGFNTVSVLMNPSHVEPFATELEQMVLDTLVHQDEQLFYSKDHFYNKYREKYGLSMHAFEPVIFQHVGLFSSLANRTNDYDHANAWYFSSSDFSSDGKPIVFNTEKWILSNT
jgi:hypothetical protein